MVYGFGVKFQIIVEAFDSIKEAEAESIIYIPIIVMIELLYLYEKGRINIDFSDTLNKIEGSQNYEIVPLEVSLLKVAESIKGLETHDRLIMATAFWLKTPLISKDEQLLKYSDLVSW